MGKGRKRRKKKKGQRSAVAVAVPVVAVAEPRTPVPLTRRVSDVSTVATLGEVEHLIKGRKTKKALARAKRLHQRLGSHETQRLMCAASALRVAELLKEGKHEEAQSMIELVSQQCPEGKGEFDTLRTELAVRTGGVDSVVQMLSRPGLSTSREAELLGLLKLALTDPGELADCRLLGSADPLRQRAGAVREALAAVCSGDSVIPLADLGQVAGESPLFPWKMFVFALAAFYEQDDDTCLAHLADIEEDTPPHQLGRVLRSMLPDGNRTGLSKPEARLAAKVVVDNTPLKEATRELRVALKRPQGRGGYDAFGRALKACARLRPDLLLRYQEAGLSDATVAGLATSRLLHRLPQPVPYDCSFWGAMAMCSERAGNIAAAVSNWESFKAVGIRLGTFLPEAPEVGAVCRRVVDLLAPLEAAELRQFKSELWQSNGSSALRRTLEESTGPRELIDAILSNQGLSVLDCAYRCLCEADPAPENYERWLDHVCSDRPAVGKRHNEVATAWCQACPKDVRPLLFLVESARKRGAFDQALKHLAAAEAVNPLAVESDEIRLGLLVAKTVRHVKRGKLHLVRKDLDELGGLPGARGAIGAAAFAALEWAAAALESPAVSPGQFKKVVAERVGGTLGAALILRGLKDGCALSLPFPLSQWPKEARVGTPDEAFSVAVACELGELMGLSLRLPDRFGKTLATLFDKRTGELTVNQLIAVGNLAVASGLPKLAYAVSGAGLALKASAVDFMAQRAHSLDYPARNRKTVCHCLALMLARREGRGELERILSEKIRRDYGMRNYSIAGEFLREPTAKFNPEDIEHILKFESEALKYPSSGKDDFWDDSSVRRERRCDCVRCRRARGEVPYYEADDDDEYDDDEYDDDEYDDDEYDDDEYDDDEYDEDDDDDLDADDLKKMSNKLREAVARLAGEGMVSFANTPQVLKRMFERYSVLDIMPHLSASQRRRFATLAGKNQTVEGRLPSLERLYELEPLLVGRALRAAGSKLGEF